MQTQSDKLEIKAWRKYRGLNQEELSRQSGLDRTYISRLERGLGNYTRSALEALSGALSVSIPKLYRRPEQTLCDAGKAQRQIINLKEWRTYRGCTQQDLADRVGVTKSYISELERGLKRYNQDILEAVAKALRCDPVDILARKPSDECDLWEAWSKLSDGQRALSLKIIQIIASSKI